MSEARTFTAGRPTQLFEMRFEPGEDGPNYDVSPDGKWFVVPRGDAAPPSRELHLVLNWFAEVTARTGSVGASRRPGAALGAGVASAIGMLASIASGIRRPQDWLWPSLLAAQAAPTTEAALRDALQRYSAALQSLDASAVKKVQPSIPVDTLAKAFSDMRELKVEIDAIKVLSSDAATARVSCRVTQTLTPKAGAKQTTTLTRVMRFRRSGGAWVIDAFER